MYLLKTRAVPVSQWKTGNKKDKDYYLPAFYSSQKKGPSNKSAHLKNEDFVWEGVQTVRIKNAGRPPLAEYVIGSLLCCFGEESAYEKVFWLAYQKSKKIIDAHPTSVKYIFLAVIVAVLMVGISLPLSRTGLLSVRVTVHLTEGILIIAALVSSVLFFVHRTLPIHHMIRTL